MLDKYSAVFEGVGKYKEKVISLKLKSNAVLKASAPRCVPENFRGKLKLELDRLVNEGIITPDNEATESLSPPIIVNKPDGTIRICLDSQFLNTQMVRNQFVLSTATEIFLQVQWL